MLIEISKMKKILLLISFALVSMCSLNAQSYNSDKTKLSNFLTRMYKHAPYDIRVVEDYDYSYLVSAVVLDPAKYGNNTGTMNRVANTKATSQAARYFNGSNISSEIIITEHSDVEIKTDVIDRIKENSVGYTGSLEQLTNFTDDSGMKVFIYYRQL